MREVSEVMAKQLKELEEKKGKYIHVPSNKPKSDTDIITQGILNIYRLEDIEKDLKALKIKQELR